MPSIFSTLLLFSLQYFSAKSQCTVQHLTFLNDYCGHIKRTLVATITNDTRDLIDDVAVNTGVETGDRIEVVSQYIGLYDVCMSRRNSYISDPMNFNYSEWSWKLSSCSGTTARITAYDSLDCTGDVLKYWDYTDGTKRNFTDISPLDEKEEEYWFWWFEDAPEFIGYGNDTYEEISVSCFSGTDDNDLELNSCEGDYFKAYRFDWPRELASDYSGFAEFDDDEMMALLTQVDSRTEANFTYKAKDLETQYRLIDTCSVTYSDYNYNEQWCVDTAGTTEVYQQKWDLATQGCIGVYDQEKRRFVNGQAKTKDCGFIESDDYKDNDAYNCLVRTVCPYFNQTRPENRTITSNCPSSSPSQSPTAPTMAPNMDGDDDSASVMNLITGFAVMIGVLFYQNL